MRTKTMTVSLFLSFALVVVAEPGLAAISWTMDTATLTPLSTNCTGVNGVNTTQCSIKDSGSGITSTASAFGTNTTNTASDKLKSAYLGVYSPGLGVTTPFGATGATGSAAPEGPIGNPSTPNHAMDNSGHFEAILFHFSSPVTLGQVKIGYPAAGSSNCSGTPCNSDISVLAYTGNGSGNYAPGSLGLGLATYAQLATNGWTVVGNYYNLSGNGDVANLSTNLYKSDWLIAAYDSAFKTASTPCVDAKTGQVSGSCGSQNSYMKLLTLSGTTTGTTPEPGTLALLSLAAVAGVWGQRRRRTVHGLTGVNG